MKPKKRQKAQALTCTVHSKTSISIPFYKLVYRAAFLLSICCLSINTLAANNLIPSAVANGNKTVNCDPLDPLLDCDGDGTPNKTDTNPTNPCIGGTIQLDTNDCDGDGITVGDGDPDDTNFCVPTPQADCEEAEEEYEDYEEDEEDYEEETSASTNKGISANINNPCGTEVTNQADCDGDGTLNNEDEDPFDPCVGAAIQLDTNDCDGDGMTVGDGDPDDFDFCTPIPSAACQDNSNEGISGQINIAEPCPNPDECFVKVQARVFLQGAYDEDEPELMYDKLRLKELLPLKEPYTNLITYEGEVNPFLSYGQKGEMTTSDVLAKSGATAIVDWVFLELHDPNIPAEVVATRSALLQRNGNIVDVDGLSAVQFNIEPGIYYLAIRHRNHLGVMTKEPVYFSQVVAEKIDFTNTKTPTYQLEDSRKASAYAQRRIDANHYLWGGNSNADRATIYQGPGLDQTKVFYDIFIDPDNVGPDGFPNYNFILRGYSLSDDNLDGEVRYQGPNNDIDDLQFFNIILHPENPGFINNKIIYEQIPLEMN